MIEAWVLRDLVFGFNGLEYFQRHTVLEQGGKEDIYEGLFLNDPEGLNEYIDAGIESKYQLLLHRAE
jgi:hypothetical protein